jgi:hypothetical protein
MFGDPMIIIWRWLSVAQHVLNLIFLSLKRFSRDSSNSSAQQLSKFGLDIPSKQVVQPDSVSSAHVESAHAHSVADSYSLQFGRFKIQKRSGVHVFGRCGVFGIHF